MKLKFLNKFSKYSQIPNFIKIRPLEAEMFQADGRTDTEADTTKLIVAFRYFANALKTERIMMGRNVPSGMLWYLTGCTLPNDCSRLNAKEECSTNNFKTVCEPGDDLS
jgi:hypothetical protein